VNDAWNNRAAPPDWLAYPDTDLDLATVRARLALISIRAGNLDRATFEVDLIRRRHADATGRLAGKTQPLVATLETMLDGAATWPELRPDDDWPMVGGGPARDGRSASLSGVTAPAWAAPIRYVPASTKVQRTFADDAGGDPRPSDPPLRYVPIVAGNQLLYRGSRHVKAADVTTGRPAVTDDGTLYRADLASRSSNITLFGSAQVGGGVLLGSPRYTLTASGGIAYAVVGSTITARPFAQGVANSLPSQQQLVGLDLGRDGLLTFKAKPDDGEWAFEGAPVVDRESLYIAMRHSDVKPRAFVACYDLADGKLRWRTPICAADLPLAGQGDAISNSLLTLAGDTIYFNTNLGAVAAVDKHDGQLRWVRRYERATTGVVARSAAHFRRELAPCIVADGIVMAAPTDTPLLFGLDAATGKTLWVTKHAGDAIDLLGIADGKLIATGDRCRGIDIRTGKLRFVWPESRQPGFVGRGRGCLAGDAVFWPTRREIYVLDAATGAQTRRPIDISSYTDCGANLVATHGLLLVATAEQLIALGPPSAAPPQKPQPALAESTLSSIVVPRPPTPDP
jgi:outer membrane protein assembly factor BamB